MHVGTIKVYFYILSARSLKEKRQVVRSIKDKLRSRFNVSVAEIGSQDTWQTGELGAAIVGNDHAYVNGILEKVKEFLERNPAIRIIDHEIEVVL